MANPQLSPPGSSVYSSDTMYVGDGTWDSTRNTFLLPNLQGFNLATTQYNGMGNRFRNMAGYHSIIKGHGIVAAITFLGIVPAAIYIARFYHRNPRLALRLHIWLQILTVGLATVIFVLGWIAVGPARSLTNPHHGIGLAIYVTILTQAIGGWWIHRREKGKERYKIPLKLMLHQWLGRAIAILGFVQVALGLTLYGSPKTLFILYALWGFTLLVAYFILTYINQPEMGFDDQGTYISEHTERSHRGHRGRGGLKALAAAGAAGAGLAALRRRSRSRRRNSGGRQDVISSHHSSRHSGSFVDDEKYSDHGHGQRTWRDRILGAAVAAAGIAAVRSLFNRKKDNETSSDISYSRSASGTHNVSQSDLSRIEEGLAPASPANDRYRREQETTHSAAMTGSPLRQAHRPRRSGESIESFESRTSFSDDGPRHGGGLGLKEGLLTLGLIGYAKHKWNQNRNRKEERHVADVRERERENERLARANSHRRRYTGDGAPPPRRNGRHGSSTIDDSDISGTNPALSRHTLPPPPMNYPSGSNIPPPQGSRTTVAAPPPSNIPMPPALPDTQGILQDSGSEAYTSAGGGRHRRHHLGRDAALAAGAAGVGAAVASSSRRDTSRQRSSNDGSVVSPPVSVKVKVHGDGRHVTLRRLNEEEAAAERESRRQERQRRRKNGSLSSLSNVGDERWRRTEAMEAAQARQSAAPIPMPEPTIPGPPPGPPPLPTHTQPQFQPQSELHLPPPPPIPAAAASGMSSPPGTNPYETGTDVSNYDSNRRRRRAERAQAKQARGGGSRVEFS
ncbi:hypothetical protein K432DRAFT_445752 [Lepidopterella palustris CBS 459.81]|uniref:Cytochrome b561 domain-containing protein n=1 Tax=Lepidopterella palustris CBS 459.81 TaxID=1314670 RepID=A0A8E2JBU2_9PEZI|nr:hypothetical protein K432DRAFT_445752 [Lepidopterella palustris CBS 459.81]